MTSFSRLLIFSLSLLLIACGGNDPVPPGYGFRQPVPVRAMPIPRMATPPVAMPIARPVVQALPTGPAPSVRAASLVVVDARTGSILHSVNSRSRRAVASTQKLLTAMVVIEGGDLWGRVTVRPEDTRVEPSKLGVRAGESYTRWDLLNALLVRSANDAATVLARDNAGSVEAFARKMNAMARRVGARRSHFVNPHGLTEDGQYSTAEDIAKIAVAARRVPLIRSIVNKKEYRFPIAGSVRRLESTNKMLSRYSFCDGMKTGYTRASGRCLVTSGSRGNREVIIVQLGSKESYIWDDGSKLLRWALEL